jgi:hypothetical protein
LEYLYISMVAGLQSWIMYSVYTDTNHRKNAIYSNHKNYPLTETPLTHLLKQAPKQNIDNLK